jgi:glutamate dehydrogenase
VIDTYPRNALFQVSEEELLKTATGIMGLQERQRVRLFVHRDRFHRFYSCLVFVPRENDNRELRTRIQSIKEEFSAPIRGLRPRASVSRPTQR